ncbi:hypothetical protein QJS10_CPB17g01591 [Acorus calamus]|uniref:Mitochondrial transcription termination factor n=1 Tax=Acorus calamus TaxID=4465 RepID=A0AAV9CVW3_ACOCL|nr:hypothetical protein QJS10_CPB17g01591 [Acorus calamus]
MKLKEEKFLEKYMIKYQEEIPQVIQANQGNVGREGFTNTQIAKLDSVFPRLVLLNPDENLKRKMDFLRGTGFSTPDLIHILSKNPTFLTCSLEKRILPDIAINRARWILNSNLNELMRPKIAALQDHGVPHDRISAMMKQHPSAFLSSSDRFREALMLVKEMSFNPSSSLFSSAHRQVHMGRENGVVWELWLV